MKKKLIALSLVIAMLAIAAVSSTLAYFTDDDNATNVFTVGNVEIELVEQQREYDADGNLVGLEDFEDDKVLLPIVGSAQGAKDEYGMPIAENYVDKIVTVDNTGASDAYIRVYVLTPVELDDPVETSVPLHWNWGNRFFADGTYTDGATNPGWVDNGVAVENVVDDAGAPVIVDVDGIDYYAWSFTFQDVIAAGESTPAAICGLYLDSTVDCDRNANGELVYTFKDEPIDFDLAAGVTIPVYAQAVQAAGFATAADAFTAAYGNGNLSYPWNA